MQGIIKLQLGLYLISLLLFSSLTINNWKMDRQLSLMDFKIAVNMLSDYIAQKDEQLKRIQQNFAKQFINQKYTTFYQWIIRTSKQNISKIQIAFQGTKSIFHDMKMDFTYSFFSKCLTTFQQTIRYLIQALNQRINKAIDFKAIPFIQQKILCSVLGVTEKENQGDTPQICGNQQIIRAKRALNKDLQSIDYYLNLLAYEDSKVYQEHEFQCKKLLLQRQNLQNIKPSNASKQIYETANMIENSLQTTQKLFQESYILKYMEFKSFLSSIKEPETIINMFKNDIESNAKDRLLQTIVKTINKHIFNMKNNNRRHRMHVSTQTDEIKNKFQEKWQSLLMVQKKNNQKLLQEIEKLKKYSNNPIEKYSDNQKKFQKEETSRKQLQNKYLILEGLYNEKCNEIMKISKFKNLFNNQILQKQTKVSVLTQTNNESRKLKLLVTSVCQTDTDFYYYYLQKNKIHQLKKRIDELQKLIKHKQYVIKELQAVRTFRDKFKSKKEICSVVVKPHNIIPGAKSLHYLHEDEESQAQFYNNEGPVKLNSIEGINSTKKQVTFINVKDKQQQTQKSLMLKKKSKKKAQGDRYRPYLTFNQKIDNSDSEEQFLIYKKDFQQPHILSLKSILKIGLANIKYDQAVQTQYSNRDQNIQKSEYTFNNSKIQRRQIQPKDTIKQKAYSKESKKSRIPSGESLKMNYKAQKNMLQYNFIGRNKSNFVEERKVQEKNNSQNVLPSVQRKSESISPIARKNQFSKSKTLFKTPKSTQRFQTQPLQVLHVNNSLNFNFNCFSPINTNIVKKSTRQGQRIGLRNESSRVKKLKK